MSDNTRDAMAPMGALNRVRGFMFTDEPCGSFTDEYQVEDRPIGIAAGGARRDRTDDLLLAKQALSQLSYGPAPVISRTWVPSKSGIGGPGKI